MMSWYTPTPTSPGPLLSVLHVLTVPASLIFVRGTVRHVKACGWTVHALSAPGPELARFGAEEGVEVHGARLCRSVAPLADLRALVDVVRVIRAVRPAIVHAHTPKAGLVALLAAALCRVPVRIYQVRGLPFETASGVRRVLLRLAERVTCRLAHRVICDGPSLHQVLVAEGLCAPTKCGTHLGGIGNGVDAQGRFDPASVPKDAVNEVRRGLGLPADAAVVGYVGRLARDKGLVELAGAWPVVWARNPSAHLLLLGRPDVRDPVPPDILDRLRRDPSVHAVGGVDDPVPYYAVMDVVALPTYREGLPNVPLEAAAMGLPVVATRTTGCVDAVVAGETGLLVPPRDARALVQALDAYLSDADLRRRHGAAGRALMLREFRPELVWNACLAQYEELLLARLVPGTVSDLACALGQGAAAAARRCFDVVVAALALILFAPLLAATALAIRLALGRPVIFCQKRAGKDGRPFTIHKFRTMREAGFEKGHLVPASARMTRLGSWLRKTSIDELPEFWDVLRGHMGIVGPRPLPVDYLALYDSKQARRHAMRPGITGWAQVNGRNATSWDDRLARDVWYVDHASPLLDLRILARTVTTVLSGRGETPQRGSLMEPFRGAPR